MSHLVRNTALCATFTLLLAACGGEKTFDTSKDTEHAIEIAVRTEDLPPGWQATTRILAQNYLDALPTSSTSVAASNPPTSTALASDQSPNGSAQNDGSTTTTVVPTQNYFNGIAGDPELANCPAWKAATSEGVSFSGRGLLYSDPEYLKAVKVDVISFDTESKASKLMDTGRSIEVGQCLKEFINGNAQPSLAPGAKLDITPSNDPALFPKIGDENAGWHFHSLYRAVAETTTTKSAVNDFIFERVGRFVVVFEFGEWNSSSGDQPALSDIRLGIITRVLNRVPTN